MGKFKDITGQKFSKLTVLYKLHNYHNKNKENIWLCVCDCGNLIEVRGSNLRGENTKSCGCLQKEAVTKHKHCKDRLYNIYYGMKDRCCNKKNKAYKRYGERGVTICDEWLSNFETFYDWSMSHGYNDTLTIDRIDNNKGYSPDNCRWVDRKTQQRNRRTAINITIDGETRCLSEWCELLNVSYNKVWKRLHRGWNIKKALGVKEVK